MNDNFNSLVTIIKQSSFEVIPGRFCYTKVSTFPTANNHFMIVQDDDEITVATKKENVSSLALIEKNKDDYALIALNVSVPFYSVGFLARVSEAIAKKNLNILIVSTYSKDYILIKYNQCLAAEAALLSLGLNKK